MPLKPNAGESKDKFIGRCMGHYINKGKDQSQAYAICISEWENQLEEHKYSVMFDSEVPNYVINQFVKEGYKVHIWGGNRMFNPTAPAIRLAKQSGVNTHLVHWGDPEYILEGNGIDMFITSDERFAHLDQFNKYIKSEDMNFAEGEIRILEERWVSRDDENTCPICHSLSEIGWVERGSSIQYQALRHNRDGWSRAPEYDKTINGLPGYRLAHSQIGEGSWKVGDNKCKCYKEFRNSTKTIELSSNPRVVSISVCDCGD